MANEFNAAERATVEALDELAAKQQAKTVERKKGRKAGEPVRKDRAGKFAKAAEATAAQVVYAEALSSELRFGAMVVKAAKAADYGTPEVAGYAALRSPSVRALIKAGRERKLDKATSLAVQLVAEVMLGKTRCDPTRWSVAQFLLKRAGLEAPEAKKDNDTKPLRDMTLEEMEALASRMSSAKTVATVPELPPSSVQVIEDKDERTL